MKAMFWFLLFIVALIFGYLIFNFVYQRTKQAGFVVFEVSAESIRAYEDLVRTLEKNAEEIRKRLDSSPLNQRLTLERRLAVLEGKIRDLKVAIEQWRQTKAPRSAADLYRQCILLYGKAAGVCELLIADTLPVPKPQE